MSDSVFQLLPYHRRNVFLGIRVRAEIPEAWRWPGFSVVLESRFPTVQPSRRWKVWISLAVTKARGTSRLGSPTGFRTTWAVLQMAQLVLIFTGPNFTPLSLAPFLKSNGERAKGRNGDDETKRNAKSLGYTRGFGFSPQPRAGKLSHSPARSHVQFN